MIKQILLLQKNETKFLQTKCHRKRYNRKNLTLTKTLRLWQIISRISELVTNTFNNFYFYISGLVRLASFQVSFIVKARNTKTITGRLYVLMAWRETERENQTSKVWLGEEEEEENTFKLTLAHAKVYLRIPYSWS